MNPLHMRNGWLISFGDLLTLLLCLFVANYHVIRGTEAGASTLVSENTEENIAKSEIEQISASKIAPGTHIANSYVGESGFFMLFADSDFDSDTGMLKQGILVKLKATENTEDLTGISFKLQLCSLREGAGAYHEISKRALALRGQLIDTSVAGIEVLGAHCDPSWGSGRKNIVAALVRVPAA